MSHGEAAVLETHAGTVILFGDRAYKVKKPVDLGFLDYTRREARHAACRREVELNRRFAPDVYLGVADVTDEDGRPCDHLVVMRRMPAARRLSSLIRAGVPVGDHLRAVARLLAAWHARAPRGPRIAAEGRRDALRARWSDSIAQVRRVLDDGGPPTPAALDEIERSTLHFLDGRDELFEARVAAGRVVDGHGDCLADDVFCLEDGPRVLDCIEFDDRLRYLDGLDDAAFLAMDLERLDPAGSDAMAARFLDWYAEFAGDPAPPALRHHYVAYRAFVRCKVACLRRAQGDPTAGAAAAGLADLTLRHLRAGAVRLLLVGGLPGTGKSTLAAGLADRLGAVVLSSDRVRKELAGLDPAAPAPAAYRHGIYAQEWTVRTYRELLDRTARLLSNGESVILDASWSDRGHREAARDVAARCRADMVALRCALPASVAAERIGRRRAAGHAVSDADESIARAMRAEADPWPEAVTVPTGGSPRESVDHAVAAALPHPPWRARRPVLPPD